MKRTYQTVTGQTAKYEYRVHCLKFRECGELTDNATGLCPKHRLTTCLHPGCGVVFKKSLRNSGYCPFHHKHRKRVYE